jgi:hypothetical protein
MLQKTTYSIFIHKSPWQWPLRGRKTHSIPKRLRGKKKPSVHLRMQMTIKTKLRTYLVPIVVCMLRVGCCVEGRLREILISRHLRDISSIPQPTFTAMSSAVNCTRAVRFNSNSYPIGIDTHASCCKVNAPHLFKDLNLGDLGEVEGIKSGLDIKGIETFKFKIKDDNGMIHEIKIPNSLYVPALKRCLLSPQHWVQEEAKDNYPRPKGIQDFPPFVFFSWWETFSLKPFRIKIKTDRRATNREMIFDNAHQQINCTCQLLHVDQS